MSIKHFEHKGVLIHECGQEGERRSDCTVPAHPNGIQVSADRWLIVYATRRFRGNDDDCSIVYQLRADRPDGKLVKEGLFAQTTDDWKPEGWRSGKRYKKEHRSPAAFGVPKGAWINGKEAPHSNVFAIRWGTVARDYDPKLNYVEGTNPDREMVMSTQAVMWTQVRLSESGDELIQIRPIERLRQIGYEDGPAFCSAENVRYTMSCRVQAVPYNEDCTEWIESGHFDGGRLAARKFRFNVSKGCYEWIETGPFIFVRQNVACGGGQIVRINGGWCVGRINTSIDGHVWHGRGLGWLRLGDPFEPYGRANQPHDLICPPVPAARGPANFFFCADGVLRCFSGDGTLSPYGNERDPLYCWDVDPDDGFRASNRRVVFDTVDAGLPIRPEAMPKVDMCKLLMPQGATQYVVHRVTMTTMLREHVHTRPEFWIFPPMNKAELASCAIYYATIEYDDVVSPPWSFPAG
jgi:hypothetical protein